MDLQQILSSLFRRPQQDNYFSVLEDRSMENPRYRQYLEQQQGLENSYPELALLMRGMGRAPVAQAAEYAPVSIGSRVRDPRQISEDAKQLIFDMWKQKQAQRLPDQYRNAMGSAYADSAGEAVQRFGLEALMNGSKFQQQ